MAARHVVVDGSNLATEGRSMPSLAQLDQAVREFLLENPEDVVTVVVDASFGHRIDNAELKMFEEAEAAGELVSPPAGAIGRGDAFLLRIADKTGATVLSNDSFQEFHGDYEWLFERGRLIGGKPVPGVGWIFTPRTPVRGPRSREAVKEAKRKTKGDAESAMPGLDLAAERSRTKGKGKKNVERAIAVALEEAVAPNDKPRRRRKGGSPPAEPVNDPLAFITFIAAHPLGAEVVATVESFSSHGAFVDCAGARCYVPLSAMGEPPPKSAREMFTKGEQVTFVVQALDPQRRGVELALPGFARIAGAPTDETVEAEIERRAADGAAETTGDGAGTPAPTPVRRTRKKAAPAAAAEAPMEPDEARASAGPAMKAATRRSRAGATAKAPPAAAPEAVAGEPTTSPPAPRRRGGRAPAEPVQEAPSEPTTSPPAPRRRGGRAPAEPIDWAGPAPAPATSPPAPAVAGPRLEGAGPRPPRLSPLTWPRDRLLRRPRRLSPLTWPRDRLLRPPRGPVRGDGPRRLRLRASPRRSRHRLRSRPRRLRLVDGPRFPDRKRPRSRPRPLRPRPLQPRPLQLGDGGVGRPVHRPPTLRRWRRFLRPLRRSPRRRRGGDRHRRLLRPPRPRPWPRHRPVPPSPAVFGGPRRHRSRPRLRTRPPRPRWRPARVATPRD